MLEPIQFRSWWWCELANEFYKWREITLKYRGKCINCDSFIDEGEKALWMQNLGVKHIECHVDSQPEKDNSALVIIDEYDKKMLGIQ